MTHLVSTIRWPLTVQQSREVIKAMFKPPRKICVLAASTKVIPVGPADSLLGWLGVKVTLF